jgi:hypothetical protein
MDMLLFSLVENRPNVAGGKALLSRAAIRDNEGAIKGPPFVAGLLPPATYGRPRGRRGARRGQALLSRAVLPPATKGPLRGARTTLLL